MLDFGEGLLDWIEIRAIGRQKPEAGACGVDCGADGAGLVTAEIVHDDDIAGAERGHQLLADIGEEALAIDRPIEDTGRGEAVAAQGGEERHGAPMTVRCETTQALPLRPPASEWRHVGLDPGFVNEHEAVGVEPALPGLPALAPAGDVPSPLFKSEQCFF